MIEMDRKVYNLKERSKLTYRQISQKTGISIGMAHRRYTRHKLMFSNLSTGS